MNLLQLFSKKNNKGMEIRKELWQETFNYIEDQWQDTPAVVKTYMYDNYENFKEHFPKSTDDKRTIYIGVFPWKSNESDIVATTMGDVHFEYPLIGKFSDLEHHSLKTMNLLPKQNHYCVSCREFSSLLDMDELCYQCKA